MSSVTVVKRHYISNGDGGVYSMNTRVRKIGEKKQQRQCVNGTVGKASSVPMTIMCTVKNKADSGR